MSYKVRHLPSDSFLVDELEIAETFAQRRRGLLGRSALAVGCGMLFPRTWSIHTFGMAFPIDVLFLDSKMGVRKAVPDLPAQRICSAFLASYCLELPAGTLDRIAVTPGDLLRIEKHVPAPVAPGTTVREHPGEPADTAAATGASP